MYIANIFPINNQEFYKGEIYSMILAPLLKKGLYNPANFQDTYVILDNGLYEESMVSTSLEDIIYLAENRGIEVDEIVVPDVMGSWPDTERLFLENLPIIKRNPQYAFMVVAHARDIEELDGIIRYLNKYDLPLTVGVPKRSLFDRTCAEARNIYRRSKHPIHFLGLQSRFSELDGARDIIRSCDTSQAACIAADLKTGISKASVRSYIREGNPVNIEDDTVDKKRIKRVLTEIKRMYE